MTPNHNRELSDFQDTLDRVKARGFKPIGVTQLYTFDTVIFETEKEAGRADELEEFDDIQFFSRKSMALAQVEHHQQFSSYIKIYWL